MELALVLLGLAAIPFILVIIFVKMREAGDRNIDWVAMQNKANYFTKRTNCRIAIVENTKTIFVRGYAGGLSGKVHDVEFSYREIRSFTRNKGNNCLLYTSPSPRDKRQSRMPSSA